MSAPDPPAYGSIGWLDLTVDEPEPLRDFYSAVVGWSPDGVDMGGYEDYAMNDAGGTARAGICAKRGVNADQASGWIPYFVVQDVDQCVQRCLELGGKMLREPKGDGARFAVIEDPSGARCALYQPS